MNWSTEADGSVLVGFNDGSTKNIWGDHPDTPHEHVKIAGFDFDDTIIHYYRRIKEIDTPWVYISEEFQRKVKQLLKEKYIIVIWTNQSGLDKKESEWKTLVDDFYLSITHELNQRLFLVIMAASKNDIYRKPNLGMYNMVIKKFGKKVEKMFYCGDAGGRSGRDFYRKKFYPTGKTGDFSDSDYKFSLNIPKCEYYTPEKYFLGESLKPKIRGFNPYLFFKEHPPEKY